ncbi:MAG: hypothetical protein ABIR32_17640 [Ilumatobacteraceae bacterium]
MSDSPNPGRPPLPPPNLPSHLPPPQFQAPQLGDASGQIAGHTAHAGDAGAAASHAAQVGPQGGSAMGRAAGDGAHRAADVQSSAHGAADAARTQGPTPSTGHRLRHLRHLRPRASFGFVGGAAAAVAIAAAGIALAARDNDPQTLTVTAETTVPITSAVEVVPTNAPVVPSNAPVVTAPPTTRAPATTDAPTTTIAVTTTTVEPTTTAAALPSGAGTYAVTGGEITISGALINGVFGTAPAQTWTFVGACDGVGECTIADEGTAIASTVGASPLPEGGTVALEAAGPGAYVITVTLPVSECGVGTGSMTIALGDGTFTSDWVVTFSGGADCPFTTLSTSYSGVRG